ncbi:hypothetical protein C8F04DRAFT_1248454 [Mycena alexandri]|uniref:Uncharacterized protein n=1 Tax=Mycena alexandri TaxID=1745969 RepID=A0AAD6THA1_9AGAR|nr:hypothetical protein C8F04DRAFT_1248454 [Mycena alexandri]
MARARYKAASSASSASATPQPRQTRSGTYFSPYELLDFVTSTATRPLETIRLKASLDTLLQQSIADADLHALYLDGLRADDEEEGWEDDDVSSRPPSPLTEPPTTPPPSAPNSPTPLACPSPSDPIGPLNLSATPAAPSPKSSVPPHGSPGIERRRRDEQARLRRARRRQTSAAQSTPYDRSLNPRHTQEYRRQPSHSTTFDLADAPVATGAWVGRRSKKPTGRIRTRQELLEDGDELVEWNGRDPKLILDADGRIVAILLGTPDDPEWPEVIRQATKAMARARRIARNRGAWRVGQLHRRGRHLSLFEGASFGGGQRRPGNLRNTRLFNYLVKELLRNKSIRRIAGFQSSGIALYAPKLYNYYCQILRALFEHHPDLIHTFDNSVLPAVTFNCGDAVAFDHCDFLNLVHGLCPVTSAGHFNHKLGGHIYLKQMRLVIEFPSGATVIIPSGCVDHGNTPIQPGETRFSITQFAAGGLFRWVEYGFQTAKSLMAQVGGQARRDAFDGVPGSRWRWALGLFSKVDELAADRSLVFRPTDATA